MTQNFRKSFPLHVKKAIQWFPGHMGKGLKIMEQKLKTVDCVIEVHDARIPFSGRNRQLKYKILDSKPHILVLNKKDMIDANQFKIISKKIEESEAVNKVIFTNCKDQLCNGVRKIIPIIKDIVSNTDRYRSMDDKTQTLMIIGVPNVGKSSLINILRNKHLKEKKAAKVGAVAGITRSVMSKIKICDEPLIYMIDTPGILEPQIEDDETGLKLALCGCFQDHLVGYEIIADYLLYWLNKHENFAYVDLMHLKNGPTDKIEEVLISGAVSMQKFKKIRNYEGRHIILPDTQYAAQYFIKNFRIGKFGKVNLDSIQFS
ncbi:mitochondrial GTPase 1 [Condylostylus longicornis]|uniref:mitochondrial GTPase 1 n=1 Tax=Condylostylus longicornis TaxID=2530218 RepID=UPI00244E00B7|nr:mitochondrial GTPase 1 [Condylostylus longicornis]